jgi:hypothetical protein
MDPWIGRRLIGLLVGAGLEPTDARLLSFGACAGMELFPLVVANLHGVVAGAAADVRRSGTLSAGDVDAGLAEIHVWAERQGAALWYALPYAAAVRRT